MSTPVKQFLTAAPVFHAVNFLATLSYYTDVLGFAVLWTNGDYGCVAKDEVNIHIYGQASEVDRQRAECTGHTLDDLFVLVADVDALYASLTSNGAEFLDEPTDCPYGMREVHLRDPNGYILTFSQSIPLSESSGRTDP